MEATSEKVVTIDYTLKDDEGNVIDSSDGKAPLTYLHGSQNIIPGLERELEGKSPGDSLEVTVAPQDGYGERNPDLLQAVPREQFPEGASPEVGQQFQAQTAAGPQIVTVVKVEDEAVTVDANHPLAGKNLNFDVTVKDVRDVTPEEREKGEIG